MKIRAKCKICGAEYWKKNGKSKYCSDKCKKTATKERQKKWREEHPGYLKEWREAHPEYDKEWYESHLHYGRDRSRDIRGSKEYERECIVCGKTFKTWLPHKWTCSKECNATYRLKRIPAEQIIDADITLEKLFKRDNGVCYLCGEKCDWSDRNVDRNAIGPRYPSIDHVFPVSKGGLHSWDNIKLAHIGCNASKRDKLLEEVI